MRVAATCASVHGGGGGGGRERERRSIKSAFHLTGLSICSTKNRCFQLSHRRTPGGGGKGGGDRGAQKMAAQRRKKKRYSNQETVVLKSGKGERGNTEGEVRSIITNVWGG